MNLLLDTCAIIWLANQAGQLSTTARDAIDQAWFVYVSPVSAWELGLKVAKGRVTLPELLETWWPRVIDTQETAGSESKRHAYSRRPRLRMVRTGLEDTP
jgi:PIN domain nuclease of toxin-antitoxin system